ncbi:alpha/beta fold hydrolase [Lichenicola cladoniae]|uniref:Alpha/beta fold hydrolase n=1 Tax=Lichenicola cladoniae TaxID=1484109 RepID=A0A6M8HHG3_9PROT|nr:alpha/beta fold hydrolase [Lichenicola cladoniae]NPD65155.1 alpha/beta fold hydrolase [Acetobacteraceae bacterium]QKE88759.1 alpha/beta fold hydrolase [Lichenicola cladoniae]
MPMIPITFSGCFGWLHPGAGTTGVVLCGAFGHENMNAHRGWKYLADHLSRQGFHVVRFDYPGTGDSLGLDTDPDRLAAWRDSISAATVFLRSATDTDSVILIGLRLGATLALLASQDIERVKAIACLAPVLSGRSYIRELRLLTNAWREANHLPAEARTGGDLDVVGKHLTNETLRTLSALKLQELEVAAKAVLLMQEFEGPLSTDLVNLLSNQGCTVLNEDFPESSDYLQNSLSSRIPEKSFRMLIDWCAALPSDQIPVVDAKPVPQPVESVLRLSNAIETPLRFGPNGKLFGILCAQTGRIPSTLPTVIMLNTGFGRHTGDGRVFVTMARELASSGIASLRMDLAGFGDSDTASDARVEPYLNDTNNDVVAAIDALEGLGHVHPVLIGICSGAYAAFHAALAEPRVRGLLLVNLQKFIWKAGSSLEVENTRLRRPLTFYVRSIAQPAAWRRIVRGNVKPLAIVKVLSSRLFLGLIRRVFLRFESITGTATRSGQIKRWLQLLNSREVDLSLLYSEADPGISELACYAQRTQTGIRNLPNVRVVMLAAADHALLDHTARNQFMDIARQIITTERVDSHAACPARSRGEVMADSV